MNVQKIVLSGLLLACAVLLPQVFHMVGGPGLGSILLPMHLPVLLAGFVVGPFFALLVGLLSPICSFIYTGGAMPAIPMLYLMIVELGVYGLTTGILYRTTKKHIYLNLIGGMVAGRLARSLMFLVLTTLFGMSLPKGMSIMVSIVNGIPGIVLQLIVLPPLIWAFLKRKEHTHD